MNALYFCCVDGHIEFPCCILLFDKSNEQTTKFETVVLSSRSNLNMINIYKEKYHEFLDIRYIHP
jgi:hypothetical protein